MQRTSFLPTHIESKSTPFHLHPLPADFPWTLSASLYHAAVTLADAQGVLSTPELRARMERVTAHIPYCLPPLPRLRATLCQHTRTYGSDGLILRAAPHDHWQLRSDGSGWLALLRQHILGTTPRPRTSHTPVIARLIRLLYALIAAAPAGGLSTRQLAVWLGVGSRQTQRDLVALSEAGFPIAEADQDDLPHYAIHEVGWSLLPSTVGPDERAALYLLLRVGLKAWGHLAPLRTLCLTLASTLPPSLQAALVAGYIPPDSYSARLLAQALAQVVAAWQEGGQLLVNGIAHEILAVEPRGGVVWVIQRPAGGQVAATPLSEWLHAELRPTALPATLALRGTLHDWVGEQVGDVVDLTSPYEEVVLLVSGAARQPFLPPAPPFHPSQQVQLLPDGRLHVTLTAPGVEGLLPTLLAWGVEVEVLAPTSLRARLHAHHTALAQRYAALPEATATGDSWPAPDAACPRSEAVGC